MASVLIYVHTVAWRSDGEALEPAVPRIPLRCMTGYSISGDCFAK